MKTVLTTLFLAGAFSVTAHAAPGSQGKMEKIDLNQDGVISLQEFTSAANERFANTDTNHDGRISKEERAAHRTQMMRERGDKRFEKLDANQDGVVSKAEADAATEQRLAERETRKAERESRKASGDEQRQKGQRNGQRGERVNPDANGDGLIDLSEHDAMVAAKFARMDKNGDGVLSGDELKPGKRGKRGKRGPRPAQ